MRIIRFRKNGSTVQLAAVNDSDKIVELQQPDFMALVRQAKLEGRSVLKFVQDIMEVSSGLPQQLDQLDLIVPIDAPEVWAAGVTYERSKEARNYESTGGKSDMATCYDKVYDAERPEIFFKSTAARTVGPGGKVQLRSDSSWQVPEPELGLVLDSSGTILGYTIGNDMSCRDIEGENPLYLPQAKVWKRSCSIGPAIRLAESVQNPYGLQIDCRIFRGGVNLVEGSASTGQLKRKLEELVSYLSRDNELFDGTVLLTGTCVVPPDTFTLAHGDRIEIDITGIGTLLNRVVGAESA